ncbi:hypothetical protein O1611_g10612 [Lasiodiplodia mahajangana]|uniref:Uncharacterized protein n=1 Tax=Lasiodiplodia mahajangana TaxID=1108764 RepID=A0ACC2IW62_9PEZI|nr:hypothetical protein O1611_g10612 [Lasiodiplodia mahajangana]
MIRLISDYSLAMKRRVVFCSAGRGCVNSRCAHENRSESDDGILEDPSGREPGVGMAHDSRHITDEFKQGADEDGNGNGEEDVDA